MIEQANAGPGYGGGGGYGPPPGGGGGGYGAPPGGGYGGPPPPPGGYGGPPGGSFGGPPAGGFGPSGPQMPGPVGPGFGPQGSSNGLAMGAMICGILALPTTCCCSILSFPIAIAAIIMGAVAMSKVKAEPHIYGGKGMAVAGVACGGVSIVLAIVFLALGMGQALVDQYQRTH